MSLRIQTNVEAINAHRRLLDTSNRLAKSMERLSSGYRINRAADDVAGLSISENLRSQIKGVAQAQRNVNDAVSMVQTAEASLEEVHTMLQRVRELAVQYKNGSLSTADRDAIQSEVNQLASEIERIGTVAEFNGIKLLDRACRISFQVGSEDNQVIAYSTISLGQTVGVSYNGLSTAGATDISEIDVALAAVSAQRSTLGAIQNRLEHTLSYSAIYEQNLIASESRIRDVDMAKEMAALTKYQILQEAGVSMLAQANLNHQSVLTLLK